MFVHWRRCWRGILMAGLFCTVCICLVLVGRSNSQVELMRISESYVHHGQTENNSVTSQLQEQQQHSVPLTTMKERLARINNVCYHWSVPGNVAVLAVYPPTETAYCMNYKVASTYWLQVFRFLYHDTFEPVEKPSDITKFETHLTKFRRVKFVDFPEEKEQALTDNYFVFMITREPYKRLWSVYVDKFVLVDSWFWDTLAPGIRAGYLAASGGKDQASAKSKCVTDISFKEFIHHVTEVGSADPGNLNEHMTPIHYTCNPCMLQPSFVGKLETLSDDKPVILERLGLTGVDAAANFTEHVKNEITTIAEFEFESVLVRGLQRRCVSGVALEKRIITAFVLNGYFREEVWAEVEPLLPLGRHRFVPTLMEFFARSELTPSESSNLRKRALLEAYSQIPLSMLSKLKDIYRYDFLLFGYEEEPPDIYAHVKHENKLMLK